MSFYDDFPSFKFRDRRGKPSNFVEDLRKELDGDRKMFDGNIGNFFGPGRHGDLRSRMGSQHPNFFRTFDSSPSRAGSASTGSAASSSSSSQSSGERVIPIHVCREGEEHVQKPQAQPSQQPQNNVAAEETTTDGGGKQNENQKSYNTQRNHTAEMPRVKEIARGQRAQSAPPSAAEVPITECGGGQSKKSTSNTGIRHIPIVVENTQGSGNASFGGTSPKPSSQQQTFMGSQGGADNNQPGDQESKPTPPKKPTLILDSMARIKAVSDQVEELSQKVKEFNASNTHKEYLYLDEMLTRLLIQLDDVEVEGKEDVRQARKECIRFIQKCITELESRAQHTSPNSDNNQAQPPVNENDNVNMDSAESNPPAPVTNVTKPTETSEKPATPAKESGKKKEKIKKEKKVAPQPEKKSEAKGPHPPTFVSEITMTVADTPDTDVSKAGNEGCEKMETA